MIIKLSPIFVIFILISCSSEPEIHSIYLQERNGVHFEVGKDTPFTGKNRTTYRTLEEITTYKDGILSGTYEKYFENFLTERTEYKDGKKHGLSKKYFKGDLTSTENYKNGIKHGLQESYHPSGVLKTKQNFMDGKEHGVSESFWYNSQLLKEQPGKVG